MLPRLWHFSADWQGHCKNRQSNDQGKAARQRRDHDVDVNTRMMRINADASNGAIRRLSANTPKNGKIDNRVLSFCSAVYDRRTGRVLEMLQSVDSRIRRRLMEAAFWSAVGSAAPHRFCLHRESLGVLCTLEVHIDGGKSAVAASLCRRSPKCWP